MSFTNVLKLMELVIKLFAGIIYWDINTYIAKLKYLAHTWSKPYNYVYFDL